MLVEEAQVLDFGTNLWIDKKQVEFIGVEAGGPSKSKKHAAPLTYGSK